MADIRNIQVNLGVDQTNFVTTLTKIQQEIRVTQTTVNMFNQTINESQSKLDTVDYGALLTAVGNAGKAFQSLSAPGMSFQQTLADLSAKTGITGNDLDKLGEHARQIGQETGLGAAQAMKAYQALSSQIDLSKVGLDGLNALQTKTMTLAKATGIEVGGAAAALAGTINQFGLEATQADRVMNVLAASAKYGAAGIPELSQALNVVGASAKSVGLSVESAAGALEVMSRGNLKGAEAGNALGDIMQKMQSSLGVDFSTTSLSSALEALKPQLNDTAYLTQLFGEGNVSAAQYLIGNASAVGEMTAKVTDSNVAQEQAAVRSQTVADRMARMRESVENLKIGLFNLTGGATVYIGIVGEMMGGIANFIPLIGLFSQMQSVNAVATNTSSAAQMKLNLSFLACPLTWIIAGIVAFVAMIVWLCSKITGWGSLWNGIVGFMKYSFLAFVEGIKLYWSTWINGFMIGINYILAKWYQFKNAMGMGDEGENNDALAKINADTESRKQALADGARKVLENANKARESLSGIEMGWKKSGNETAEETGTNTGMSPAVLPGASNASIIPTYQTTSPDVVKKSSEGTVGGGPRSGGVTLNLGKLMDNVNIYAQEFRDGLNDLDNQVLESLTRVLNIAQSNAV